jgi:hypothetical protein
MALIPGIAFRRQSRFAFHPAPRNPAVRIARVGAPDAIGFWLAVCPTDPNVVHLRTAFPQQPEPPQPLRNLKFECDECGAAQTVKVNADCYTVETTPALPHIALNPTPPRPAPRDAPARETMTTSRQETPAMDYDDIDPAADAASSYPEFAKKKRRLIRPPTEDEMLDSSPYFIEGVTPHDLVFSGYVGPLPKFVDAGLGVIVQPVSAEQQFSIYSLKFNGKWDKRIGEPTPIKPPGYRWDDTRRGFVDDAGHGVGRDVFVNVLRRGDPTLYSIKFSGPEAKNADNWLDAAHNFGLPLWGARWRMFMVESDGHRPGQTFRNWDLRLAARYGDASPEAPSREEYLHAKALAKGAASTPAAAPRQGAPSPNTWDAPPPNEAPPVEAIDDMPF